MKPRMNMKLKQSLWLLLSLMMVATLAIPHGFAATTDADAGDVISNVAIINYSVGTVAQTAVTSSAAEFVVDHKVRPFVDNAVGTAAVPSGSAAYLTFTVTNDGNTNSTAPADTLELQLTAVADAANVFPVTDIMIYRESLAYPAADGLDVMADTLVSDYSGPSLGTITLARDETATIYVVATMDAGATNGQTASVHLIATAWDAGIPGAMLPDGDGDQAMGTPDVVFADDAGTAPGDGQYGGQHSLNATYTIASAVLGVTKASVNLGDPYGTNYHVPGATVQYTITINNTGPTPAADVQVVDQVPAGTDFLVASAASSLAISSVEYSATVSAVPPPLAADWLYAPVGAPGTPDPAVTWIRINLSGTVPATVGSETAQFNVIIE